MVGFEDAVFVATKLTDCLRNATEQNFRSTPQLFDLCHSVWGRFALRENHEYKRDTRRGMCPWTPSCGNGHAFKG